MTLTQRKLKYFQTHLFIAILQHVLYDSHTAKGPFKVALWWCHTSSPTAESASNWNSFTCVNEKEFTAITLHSSIFFSLSLRSRFLSPVKLSNLYSYKATHKAVIPRCAKSVKVKRHLPAARIGCNTTHLLPSLLLLSSSPCLPKIGQLWTMWP